MRASRLMPLVLVSLFGLSGCVSITPTELMNIGDATQKTDIVGKSTHFDLAGLGVNEKQFVDEYNSAIDNAFQNAPAGTTVLKNMKVFKSPKSWPLWAGFGSMAAGAGLMASGGVPPQGAAPGIGAFLFLTGMGISMVTNYDFVVIAEPSAE